MRNILIVFCFLSLIMGCQPTNASTKHHPTRMGASPLNSSSLMSSTVDKNKQIEVAKKLVKEKNKQDKVAYVLTKTKELGLPSTLAAVPVVESNYKNQTVSSKGAAGEWQLMPAIAKQYGISTQARFNFYSSTQVALHYLKDLHAQFGSWPLALAAYNAGEFRVLHALHKNPNTTDVSQLDLPYQTKQYVAKIMRLNQIIVSA